MSRPIAVCLVAAGFSVALAGCGSPGTSGSAESPAAATAGDPPATATEPGEGTPTSINPTDVIRPSDKPLASLNGKVDTGPTDLTITVRANSDAEPNTWTLTCHPAGGNHPQAQQACDALAQAGGAAGLRIPADRLCAQVYGGPATATIDGTLDGNRVQARLAQTDGCRIAQWDALSEVLGSHSSANS